MRTKAYAPEWLPATGQLIELVNPWANRDDISVHLTTSKAESFGTAACFDHSIAEVTVNTDLAFGEEVRPEVIGDLRERSVQFEWPVAIGATLHEAMHARHTLWNREVYTTPGLATPLEREVFKCLEEIRIEARGVVNYPANRSFLRSSALEFVLRDMDPAKSLEAGHLSVATLLILALGRVSAGVLEADDIEPITTAIDDAFPGLPAALLPILDRAAANRADTDWRPQMELAREYLRTYNETAGVDLEREAASPEIPEELLALLLALFGAIGEDGEFEGGLLNMSAEDTGDSARDEGFQQEQTELAEAEEAARKEAAKEAAKDEKAAEDVFGTGRGTGPSGHRTGSRLVEARPPRGEERAAAVSLARDFERAQYRDRIAVKRASALPPGRLKMRSAMQGDVQRSRGQMVTATPWESTHRYHVEDPKLTLGAMVDISGSMGSAMEPMASAAWILSESVRRIQGTAAITYYWNDVFPVLRPGQHLEEVSVYSASDGTERFDKSFRALNGTIRLLGGTGARLLVVVSDLYHTSQEREAAKHWFGQCKRDGVGVLVVAPSASMAVNAREVVGSNGEVVSTERGDVTAMSRAIGAAAVRQLSMASR